MLSRVDMPNPRLSRRRILAGMGASAAMAALPLRLHAAELDTSGLKPLTAGALPIGKDERLARIARAQTLMRANDIGAVLVEAGASLDYFTGVRWWRSERLTAAVIPAEGDPIIVTPFFERPSVAETLNIPAEIRVWQEDEEPLAIVAAFLAERGLSSARIGIEETVRYFAIDRLQQQAPKVRIVNANPVVRACRMRKTAPEIALMQTASDITMAAFRWAHERVRAGMTRDEVDALVTAATRALGGNTDGGLVLIGEAAAYPHGSGKRQIVKPGSVILLDCGCNVHGYQSDISRSFIFGAKPTADQRKVWGEVHRGQEIAFAAAKIGAPAGSVDDAVRGYYQSLGYGPGYTLPGLSHRTGHGIGMEGHEPVNLVHGETTKLAPGMCFSNEPGLYLPGHFGIRLEDCFHMTDAGPKWFSTPPPSIDDPFG